MDNIKERIKQIMLREGLTAMAFAENIGVAQATVSHVLGPRNRYPSTDFLLRLHNRYPHVSLNWLLTGEGDMMTDGSASNEKPNPLPDIMPSLFDPQPLSRPTQEASPDNPERSPGEKSSEQRPMVAEERTNTVKIRRRVVEIRVFYDDSTYEVFTAPQ